MKVKHVCDNCKRITFKEYVPPKQGASVLFYKKDPLKVLLIKRDDIDNIPYPGMIDLIGGAVEEGESPEEAAYREMKEEIVLNTERFDQHPVTLRHFKTFEGVHGTEEWLYICELPDLKEDEFELKEGEKVMWMTREEVEKIDMAFGFTKHILEAIDSL